MERRLSRLSFEHAILVAAGRRIKNSKVQHKEQIKRLTDEVEMGPLTQASEQHISLCCISFDLSLVDIIVVVLCILSCTF